jgi:glutathione-regulated potassium-efflux system ancillary protein KefC
MQLVGVSPAMGTFIAGVVLANSEYRHTLQTDIEPFKGLLLGLFFISVGMGMDFHLFAESPLRLLLAVAALIIVKAFILFMLGRFFGLNALHNAGFALALAQGGEFAFVLFQFAGTLNILPQTTVLEKDPDQIELLRKFGFKGYFGDASRLDLLCSAGAAKAK